MASIFHGKHKSNTWASQLMNTSKEKETQLWDWASGKNKTFYSKALIENPLYIYFSLFNSNLIYDCQIWGQDQSDEFKKVEKLQEKAIRIISFLPYATVEKLMYEMNILKLKDFTIGLHASKYLICKRLLD